MRKREVEVHLLRSVCQAALKDRGTGGQSIKGTCFCFVNEEFWVFMVELGLLGLIKTLLSLNFCGYS